MDPSLPKTARLDTLLRTVAEGSRRAAWVRSSGVAALVLGATGAGGILLARSLAGWDPLAAIGRLALGDPRLEPGANGSAAGAALLIAAVLVLSFAYGWLRSRGAGLDEASSALWLDLRAGSGGEVVTASELGSEEGSGAGAWGARAATLAQTVEARPEIQWQPAGYRMGAAAAAIALVCLVPVRVADLGGSNGLPEIFEQRIEELEEKLTALDEEVGLGLEERSDVQDALERLEASLDESPDLEATYEALDTLEEQLEARAEEALTAASEALAKISEEAREAEMDGAAGDLADASLDASELDNLSNLLADLDLPGSGLDLAGAELGDALAGADLEELASLSEADLSGLSAEELAALSEAMRAALTEPLESLAQAGLLKDAAKFSGPFKPASGLPKLTAEQLAMLEACPDCGKKPGGT